MLKLPPLPLLLLQVQSPLLALRQRQRVALPPLVLLTLAKPSRPASATTCRMLACSHGMTTVSSQRANSLTAVNQAAIVFEDRFTPMLGRGRST